MPLPRALSSSMRSARALGVVAVALWLGCARAHGDGGAADHGDAPKPSVEVATLHRQSLRESADYLAQLVSRHQVVLYPQVVGVVTAIAVKPGDVVKQGATILQLDLRKEAATLAALAADKDQQAATLALTRSVAKRSGALLDQGLVGQQQYEQDKGAVDVAEQQLKAKQAAIEAQAMQLAYYRIVAPFDGVVGDVPVKLGDLVSATTKLTSISDNAKLEAYVKLPVEQLGKLGKESRIEVLDADGTSVAEGPVTFVAPDADPAAQVVLVKGLLDNGAMAPARAFRAGQVVRVRVVFRTHPGVRLPIEAVTRQAGQYFAFVVEADKEGSDVVHQRPVELGELDGNQYDVVKGLAAGDRIAVSQIQKLHDGGGVVATSPSSSPSSSARR
ncbi:MAG: efflux RND transporter periplasmic adaptor subunit [Polyangiales bacterium]